MDAYSNMVHVDLEYGRVCQLAAVNLVCEFTFMCSALQLLNFVYMAMTFATNAKLIEVSASLAPV
jgi:hypothetical protein